MTSPDRHQRISELFLQARGLAPEERRAFLDEACADEPALRGEVEALIAKDSDLAGFLEEPPLLDGEVSASDLPPTLASDRPAVTVDSKPSGSRPQVAVEGYEIVRELHRGGQGVVYQAIQKATKRKVALKVLIEGPLASKSARRRFEREIELVAQLKHPNIIVIFDSGVTPEGWHFYAMDYIRGLPLNQYVQQEQLTLDATLDVFAKVCEAVQYAHYKGVIHRDLKPSNILVDGEGNPKVLDFGLAKQLAAPVETVISMTQDVIGTLPYMSPEQARGNPDNVDMRTDIYALGVVLYEMLTGHYPYPVVGHMAEVLKHIAETPPTPPSRKWTADSGVTKRSSRHIRAGKCPIDSELQTVILKTLSKDRGRRYQSAGDLARDLSHYLAGEPLEAKRDSGWYLLRKTVQKFKAAFAIGAIFLTIIMTALVVSTTLWRQAERATMRAALLHGTMIKVFETLRHIEESDVEPASLDHVQQAIALLEEESIVESSSRDYVEQAIAFLESESLPAQEDVETLAADVEAAHLVEEGRVLAQRGSWDDAWDKFTEAGLIDPDHFGVLANKAWWKKEVSFLRDSSKIKEPASLDEADDLCSRALKIKSDSKGLWNLKSAIALGMGQLKDAEAASREALKIDPNYPPASSGLAKILAMQHKFTEALRVAKEGAQFQEQTGKRGKYQCDIWQTLASLQLYLGERGALESANKAHDVYRRDTRNWLIRARIHLTVAEHLDAAEALLNAHGAANFTTLREPKFKRILAQAQLRNGYYQDAILNASAAMEEGDLPVVCHLIKAVAHANMGERADAANELGEAHEHWPEQFDAGDDVIVTAEKGLLWFDTRAELIQLRREATELISAP